MAKHKNRFIDSKWKFPEHTHRINYTHRNWIGKSDPSGFGQFVLYVSSEHAARSAEDALRHKGHRIDAVQQRPG